MAERSRSGDRPPSFDAVEHDEDLVEWSRRYCERAVAVHGLDVDLDRVDWEVSTRARRRAAAVKRPKLDDAVVGERREWDDDPPTCTMSLSRAAFEAFDRGEWRETLRHELVHVEQFQAYGTTDHGEAFEGRAEAIDAPLGCRRFAEARYVLTCGDCGEVVARRYRASTLVTESERYRSTCCAADLECTERTDA